MKNEEIRKLEGYAYESVGRVFESRRAHQLTQGVTDFGLWPLLRLWANLCVKILKKLDFFYRFGHLNYRFGVRAYFSRASREYQRQP